MRGKVFGCLWLGETRGITPAYAGKSYRSESWNFHLTGSPPPMRGKAVSSFDCRFCAGITPAYAGKRRSACVKMSLSQDHPRLCGEKQSGCRYTTHQQGSPPPMRGKVIFCIDKSLYVRITPAYAGKSRVAYPVHSNRRDHPRLCGEKVQRHYLVVTIQGSPPPMRGKGEDRRSSATDNGITPAYAGKRYSCYHLLFCF